MVKCVWSITTYNASGMVKGVGMLREKLQLPYPSIYDGENFHVRCVVHVINLGVRDLMGLIRK